MKIMKLEIIVITYNRSKYLKNTLENILNSSLKLYNVTVLNNASTDDTLEVCDSYKDKFPFFKVVTHAHNIGLGANIIRALELGSATYTWVLCDDDILDFSFLEDVDQVLDEGIVDLLHVGGHPIKPWTEGGKYDNIKSLFSRGYPYFKYASFLPSNIFKTKTFQTTSLISGYANVVNAYPHMPYLLGLYEQDARIYLSKHRLITARMTGQSYNETEWYRWWVHTCNDDNDYLKRFMSKYFKNSDKAYFRNSKIRHIFKLNNLIDLIKS
ncbi:MAG: glycosyltransferase family 2 protein [Sphingobacteriaceae bacterium]|nr:MAG: glycosyltransferase family 2 protein [Sphingobacteriaceae bacterium]